MTYGHFGRILLLGCWMTSLATGCSAGETDWKAGVAGVSITPDQPVPMAGYAERTGPYERVEHDLFAKALALEDREGHRAVLITTDLVGIPRDVAEPICDRIQQLTGLDRHHILLSSSHNHSGPLLTLDEGTRYANIAPEDGRHLLAYTKQLQTKLAELAAQALATLAPARLARGNGIAHFVMNRREHTTQGVILGVNPSGLVDRTVPVLRVEDAQGMVRAVVFSYACHNTTLTGANTSLCADYAGFAQRHVETKLAGAMALFMCGCGGDANPFPRGSMDNARRHGTALGEEVCRVLGDALTPVSGPLRCGFERASLPLQAFDRAELTRMAETGPSWQSGNARQLLTLMRQGQPLPTTYDCPVAVWQFGGDLTLVGLGGEVVVEYVPLLQRALGPEPLWAVAYCNDVFGYVPSASQLAEGGYECRGLYTSPGFFSPQAERVLVETTRALAARTGRTVPQP